MVKSLFHANDIQYEQTLQYDLKSVKSWTLYLESKKQNLHEKHHEARSSVARQKSIGWPQVQALLQEAYNVNLIFERALHELPSSYKLWWQYLEERRFQISLLDSLLENLVDLRTSSTEAEGGNDDEETPHHRTIPFDTYNQSRDKALESLFACYERALCTMHKMPLIWISYVKLLHQEARFTKCRRVLNRALASLPLSQHASIWNVYLPLISTSEYCPLPVTVHTYNRYIRFNPQHREDFVSLLLEKGRYNDAVEHLLAMLNDPHFKTSHNQSKYDIWLKLCDIISKHPRHITRFSVENIIRAGLEKFQSAEQAHLWCALAMYYINIGLFEKARDIYEEAIQTVDTVRDFTTIFEAYTRAEDEIMNTVMMTENGDDMEDSDSFDDTIHIQLSRLERLIERRPELLNAVKLRHNPNNVAEWHHRVRLFAHDPDKVVSIYSEALSKVNPKQATTDVSTLWCSFAQYYEIQFQDLETARAIFEKAVLEAFSSTHELAEVWLAYAEMEIRNMNITNAQKLLERATSYSQDQEDHRFVSKSGRRKQKSTLDKSKDTVQQRVYRNVQLWCLRIDLEECTGDLDSTRALYEETIDLKIATPQMILNYAQMLEKNHYFEDSFKAYERSVYLFMYPQNYLLWSTYIIKFIERYGGSQVERTRDIFEQVIRSFRSRNRANQKEEDEDYEEQVDADPRYARDIYLLYAKFEEDYGLIKRAMSVYDRGVRSVPLEVVTDLYIVYINRAAEFYGVTKTRSLYEQAIESVPRSRIKDICLRFVELEKKLGEVDRARAIFTHCAKYCNPDEEPEFWAAWEKFEETYVDFDSYKEMLRTKKSVSTSFSSIISFTTQKNVDADRVTNAIRSGNLGEMKEIIRQAG